MAKVIKVEDWGAALAEPFPAKDIEWRVQRSGVKNNKGWAMVLAYVTNRAIMERLDEVVGIGNWKNEFKPAPDGGVMCGISLQFFNEYGNQWVAKWDGAENTNVEAVKGGLSSAMKRAGVQWGIGRYLYNLDGGFVNIEPVKSETTGTTNYINDKSTGATGYWAAPALPLWALPTAVVKQALDAMPPEQPTTPLDKAIIAKMGTALKLKGFTDKAAMVNMLNRMAIEMYGAFGYDSLTEEQAAEMTAAISRSTKDALEASYGRTS